MTNERPGPPQSVPTLTEVLELPEAARVPVTEAAGEPSPPPAAAVDGAAPSPAPPPASSSLDEDQLTERILTELQRQVDLVLEYRVRELLTPILTRATDALVRDTRVELSRSLRDLVARSVAQEISRLRAR